MNASALSIGLLLLAATVGAPQAMAQSLPNSNNNPYNSPIHRANPNSMQGTRPSTPAVRGPAVNPVPRPPTLQNGGIGNSAPRPAPAPSSTPKAESRNSGNTR
ncbi:hypothetical protein RG836_02860 [Pseudomonas sp. SZMC_28357]|uniref:hypothetical protein n=1 Tax=Pseudomonas sp. SZMC_28357 TaxID=3074380 RepID=UPI002871E6EE|nr:hypothetical protein [Pseudomonas sp. SZMC_28357]MDR9750376.1 hypothetical protein [Pseudomonas sp. SZMC_28357]